METPRLALRDPPEDLGGMRTVVLDPAGRLVASTRHPEAGAGVGAAPGTVDWAAYLAAADLGDIALSPCAPELHVPTFADARAAWCGAGAARPHAAVHVESASLGEVPLSFVVLNKDPGNQQSVFGRPQRKAVAQGLGQIVMIVTLLAALPLARRNVQCGRGDARTALRVASALFLLRLTEWLLNMSHHESLAEELNLLQAGLFGCAFQALAVGIYYLALEPLARRYWPYALISWTRLSSGRGWDAIVGQHVLVGGLLGILWATLLTIDRWVVQEMGWGLRPMIWEERFTLPLLGARYAVALAAHVLSRALIYGLLIMLVLALLRALVRKPLLAAVLATMVIALMFLPFGNSARTAWLVVGLGCVGSAIWAVMRYGLLALITAVFVLGALSLFPMTLRAAAWFADLTLFALAIVMLSLVGGFLIARRAPSLA